MKIRVYLLMKQINGMAVRKIKLHMEALDTQFPDDGLENRLKENELNDNVQGRNSGNDKGILILNFAL